ncbi:SDR family NAD(P)-dependent oxidoreductase [Nocardia aurantiaca]|uniref:SDR family NAD(P)-dependent oxidoreductase n=1 Tax=Nocardia aurantiaca TaxID=2675850 RepID=A0A6I3KX78_9NOCA|nr:SDR family NAD(P)-dependent oxidoreductase [Nocardia aurantiaca]MTE12079.1 SDR family NAD(P)-dependent oxidoreductase [Nocardia aurantiaca]
MSIALVTGANQGLGRAVAELLARRLEDGSTVYLSGRNAERVTEAASAIPGAEPLVLDVSDDQDVAEAARLIRERHGGIDLVVSNAAARRSADRSDAETIREFVETNNLGTSRMIREFGPLVRTGGRFLIVASAFGSLRYLDPALWHLFDTETRDLADIDRVMLEYADLVEAGKDHEAGWPASINTVSKIGQVASARIFARTDAAARGIYIGAVCPGLVDTEASRPWFTDMSQAQTPEAAAVDVVSLAVDPIDPAVVGQLVQHRVVIGWTTGMDGDPQQPDRR